MVDGPCVSASRYLYERVEGLGGSIFTASLPCVLEVDQNVPAATHTGSGRR